MLKHIESNISMGCIYFFTKLHIKGNLVILINTEMQIPNLCGTYPFLHKGNAKDHYKRMSNYTCAALLCFYNIQKSTAEQLLMAFPFNSGFGFMYGMLNFPIKTFGKCLNLALYRSGVSRNQS